MKTVLPKILLVWLMATNVLAASFELIGETIAIADVSTTTERIADASEFGRPWKTSQEQVGSAVMILRSERGAQTVGRMSGVQPSWPFPSESCFQVFGVYYKNQKCVLVDIVPNYKFLDLKSQIVSSRILGGRGTVWTVLFNDSGTEIILATGR